MDQEQLPGAAPADEPGRSAGLEPAEQRRRLWWVVRFLLVVFILGFAFSVTGWMAWVLYAKNWMIPAEVLVPKLEGMTQGQALTRSKECGLRLVVEESRYAANMPADIVLKQDPPPGRSVRQGREIMVVVSLGPELKAVPNLFGFTLREARVILNNCKLQAGQVVLKKTGKVEPNRVFDQEPSFNTQVPKGTRVTLYVSAGSDATISLPNWQGRQINDVMGEIEKLNLEPGEMNWVRNPDHPQGWVISQGIPPGTTVNVQSPVDLQISGGPQWGEMTLKQRTISIVTPVGKDNIPVKVMQSDETGQRTIYQGTHPGGDRIRLLVSCWNSGDVIIYIDGKIESRVQI